jgi:ribonucleotide monophosphatase NagD (HAD superfamily)
VSRKHDGDDRLPPRKTLGELLPSYEGLLLDAYGVLNDSEGPLPGAAALLDRLTINGFRYYVVTNDASRLPETLERRFAAMGLAIPADRILTAGGLLGRWFTRHRMAGARTVVLGPADSVTYVERAGGTVVPLARDAEYDVLCVADESGYAFLPAIDAALTSLTRMADRGRSPRLVLPNPDFIYPTPDGFGFGGGAAAILLEAAIGRRFGGSTTLMFERLGKPHRPLFDEAVGRAGTSRLLVIGDQLETDIAGARAAGLDSALLETGVSRWRAGDVAVEPTYLLDSLD